METEGLKDYEGLEVELLEQLNKKRQLDRALYRYDTALAQYMGNAGTQSKQGYTAFKRFLDNTVKEIKDLSGETELIEQSIREDRERQIAARNAKNQAWLEGLKNGI